ncbi:hypothetical protein N7456_013275 [Penicillium angulare]|uniref:Uncharacterized protein n=1 Tax=Penicillium angulare TaxID=116970 RepID=A0A9W9EHJ1_9EURO|nr:hypothetical protein N7456_013275 [Penicillium angulare]
MFSLFSGLIGTAFSVLIRLELSDQYNNSSCYINDILMVMPALIGGFGNFLLPLLKMEQEQVEHYIHHCQEYNLIVDQV